MFHLHPDGFGHRVTTHTRRTAARVGMAGHVVQRFYRNDSVPLCSYDSKDMDRPGLGGMTVALPASHARPEIVVRPCSTG